MKYIFDDTTEIIKNINVLQPGDTVIFNGELLVMRDAAQKKLLELDSINNLPVKLENRIVFYAGPSRTPPNFIIGSIGPTTSARMDEYLEFLYSKGVAATVGKGPRTREAVELTKKYGRIYFITLSGAAALLSKTIMEYEILAFRELGPEAIARIRVKSFPLIVAINSVGKTIF